MDLENCFYFRNQTEYFLISHQHGHRAQKIAFLSLGGERERERERVGGRDEKTEREFEKKEKRKNSKIIGIY
jgi:hypothetical protein